MTAGFVGYQAAVLRKIDISQIRSEGYAFLMEMKFNLNRRGATFHELPIIFTEREIRKVEIQHQDHVRRSTVPRESDDAADAMAKENH